MSGNPEYGAPPPEATLNKPNTKQLRIPKILSRLLGMLQKKTPSKSPPREPLSPKIADLVHAGYMYTDKGWVFDTARQRQNNLPEKD